MPDVALHEMPDFIGKLCGSYSLSRSLISKEQLYPPAAFVELGNGQCWQDEVVSQENQSLCRNPSPDNSPGGSGPGSARRSWEASTSRLGHYTRRASVHRARFQPVDLQAGFGARDKERAG